MQKTFQSDKYLPTSIFLWVTVIFLISTPFFTPNDQLDMIVPLIICLATAVLLIWILLDTKYKIKGSFLHYYSGPIRGKIDIFRITKITNHEGLFVGTTLKPALGTKGLIIYYSKYDNIYISPKNKEAFIESLLAVNSHIEVK